MERAEMEYGGIAIYVYWRTIEYLAEVEAFNGPAMVPEKVFKAKFNGLTNKKLWDILDFFDTWNVLEFARNAGEVLIFSKKLLAISSTYKKTLQNNITIEEREERREKEDLSFTGSINR